MRRQRYGGQVCAVRAQLSNETHIGSQFSERKPSRVKAGGERERESSRSSISRHVVYVRVTGENATELSAQLYHVVVRAGSRGGSSHPSSCEYEHADEGLRGDRRVRVNV